MSGPGPAPITFEQLAELREKTESLAQFLSTRLKRHLATLYPILAPQRVFGKYLGARESGARADEAYAQLTDKYRESSGTPFDLRPDLEESALKSAENGVEIYPWEYTLAIGEKSLTVSSPVRWVITYRSDFSLAEMRRLASGAGENRKSAVRDFVVNALAMSVVFAYNPSAVQLLEDLRYEVWTETAPGLGKLPLLTIGWPISSFRPPNELIQAAVRFSGVPAFVELVDPRAVQDLGDPFREELVRILAGQERA